MMTSEPETPVVQPENFKAAHARKQALASQLRKTLALADRVHVMADGSRWFVRFRSVEILEHWLVLISFTILSLTGLMQRFASLNIFAWAINAVFRDIEAVQAVHQATAICFVALCLFHFVRILTVWFVMREPGAMLPRRGDGSDLLKMIQYNLGSIKLRPLFDRFAIEEKHGYWALLIFAPIMVLTGLIQWFPTFVTRLFPVAVIPLARSIHSMSAFLAIAVVLTWHLYYTVFKERNSSMFTGLMSEQTMRENHPLEHQRIIAAHEKIQTMRKGQ